MEILDRFIDMRQLIKAVTTESKSGPSDALSILSGDCRSTKYIPLWNTMKIRLSVLSRKNTLNDFNSVLEKQDWFKTPNTDYEKYCSIYIEYLKARLNGDEAREKLIKISLANLTVSRFVRRALLVT